MFAGLDSRIRGPKTERERYSHSLVWYEPPGSHDRNPADRGRRMGQYKNSGAVTAQCLLDHSVDIHAVGGDHDDSAAGVRHERFAQGGSPVRNHLAFAVLLSLLALTRPLELIIDLVMYGYIAVRCIGAARMNKRAIFSIRHFAIAAALFGGIVIGPALMAAFNLQVYEHVTSPYRQVMRDIGLDLVTIPKKFVSLFNDGASVFLTPKQTFIRGYPWLALTMAMIPSVLAFGPRILRLITVIACLHVALYLAFGDLLPNNLYTFHAIHYFKLWIPYFALIAAAGLLSLYRARASAAAPYVAAGGVALAALLCPLGFRFTVEPIRTTLVAPHTITVEPASGSEATLDSIDFPALSSDTALKYLIGANQVVADDKRLRLLGDVHLLKGAFGLRAMFTRQLTFHRLVITLDDSFRIPDKISAYGVCNPPLVCVGRYNRKH